MRHVRRGYQALQYRGNDPEVETQRNGMEHLQVLLDLSLEDESFRVVVQSG